MEKRLPPGHQTPHPLSSSPSLRSEHFRNPVERVGRAQVGTQGPETLTDQ